MPKTLKIVAQEAMDLFYTHYKTSEDFFDIEDFIAYCYNAIADLYEKEYSRQYAEIRADHQDEVVNFSHEWLASKILQVEKGEAKIDFEVMAFLRDKQSIGIQDIEPIKPRNARLQRSNPTENWQSQYLPNTNDVFWKKEGGKLKFESKNECNLQQVEVFYVPGMDEDMLVPDGIIDYIVKTNPVQMKQIMQGTVIKEVNDGNPNRVMETELNTAPLKHN